MAQMLSRPAIRPAPGLRSPKLLFPLRDAAPMTERRRIVAAKATAASTAPVYLTGAGGAPRTLKLQSRSNDALSDWISRTAKPPAVRPHAEPLRIPEGERAAPVEKLSALKGYGPHFQGPAMGSRDLHPDAAVPPGLHVGRQAHRGEDPGIDRGGGAFREAGGTALRHDAALDKAVGVPELSLVAGLEPQAVGRGGGA